MIRLRPYQEEIARAVLESVEERRGLVFSVEMARQGGKNELSAILEAVLLTLHLESGGSMVKASPTFRPQAIISMERLKQRLDGLGYGGIWHSELPYTISLGAARCVFLSAEGRASVMGHTADILLEMDEAQDISRQKYTREFRPMGSASNCTTVLYGTAWDDASLLEEVKQANLELQRKDGVRRHFGFDWQEVARYNEDYRRYVEAEMERLGKDHPLFLTQYALVPIHGGGRLLDLRQLALLQGGHPRRQRREEGKFYVAGIDLAGEEPPAEEYESVRLPLRARDATAIVIAEVSDPPRETALPAGPQIKVVELCCWTGVEHHRLYPQMVSILKDLWACRRVVVDTTGLGEPVASFLRKALGSRVRGVKFNPQSKSALGFNLLAAVNSGRLKVFAGDGSAEYGELMAELEKARAQYRANQTMDFYVDRAEGHDDLLMALALAVEAAGDVQPRPVRVYQRR
jgi:hypothetical protein